MVWVYNTEKYLFIVLLGDTLSSWRISKMTEVEEKAISLSHKLKKQYPLLDGTMYTLNELENIISSCNDLSD